MLIPPTMVWGFRAKAKPGITPKAIEHASLPLLTGQGASIEIVSWRTCDFGIEGFDELEGSFMTIELSIRGELHQLVQHDSSFYTDRAGLDLRPVFECDLVEPTEVRPDWRRRSARSWPLLHGRPLSFVGQFQTASSVFYVFGDAAQQEPLAILRDELGIQDVEGHYDDEARRA